MTEQIMRDNLAVLAQAFADGTGLALTTVSKRIHGKHDFLEKFIAGEVSTGVNTYFAMVDALRAKWPTGVKWPITREVPKLSRTPYVANPNLSAAARARVPAKRGDGGKFLGKNVPKGKRR